MITKFIKRVLTLIFICNAVLVLGQEPAEEIKLTPEDFEYLLEQEEKAKEVLKEISTPGVKIEGQEMIFSKEALKLLRDEAYRNEVYKDEYTWQDVQGALARNEIQKAFWQMLNLYPDYKDTVVQFMYAYDNVLPVDEVVVASFYTYGFFDPRITSLEGDKPNVHRPDIFEEYLRRSREIVAYIIYLRKESGVTKS